MWKNQTLERLCEEIAGRPLDWNAILDILVPFLNSREKVYNLKDIAGFIGELHLRKTLEELSEFKPELSINIYDIDFSESNGLSLSYLPRGGVEIWDVQNYRIAAEYDELLLIEDKPVVFEVKTGRYHDKKGSVKRLLSFENYKDKIEPAKEFFEQDVGLVLVVCKDVHRKITCDTSREVKKFFKNNGMCTSIPFTVHEFESEVEDVLRGWKIPYKK